MRSSATWFRVAIPFEESTSREWLRQIFGFSAAADFRATQGSLGGWCNRQPDLKTRVTWFRSDLNISAMLLHNPLNCVQPESGPLSNALSCEKRFEDVGLHVRWNSRAIISNLNHNASVVAIGAHPKLALAVHRIDRVIDDVGPDLVELAAERIHQQRNSLIIALHRYSLFQFMVQNSERVF